MHRQLLALVFALGTTQLVHAHEIEGHFAGYGLGPFGMNVGLDLNERATFTVGIDAYYGSSQAEGFGSSEVVGATLPVGFKFYLRSLDLDSVVPHVRVLGMIGVGRDNYDGYHQLSRYFGGYAALGVTYLFREQFGFSSEMGVGYGVRHQDENSDRFGMLAWRVTLIFRFGETGFA